MARETKLSLSNNKFQQLTGDTLTLSGISQIHGNLLIQTGGSLTIIDGNQANGFLLTSDASGNTSLKAPLFKQITQFDSNIDTTGLAFFNGEFENLEVQKFDEINTFTFQARLNTSTGFTSISGETNTEQVTNLQIWVTTNTTPFTSFLVQSSVVYADGETGESSLIFIYNDLAL